MKFSLSLAVLFFSFGTNAFASDLNDTCKFVLGDGTESMIETIEEFANKQISTAELAAHSMAVSTKVRSVRFACQFSETPENESCVNRYDEVYTNVRKKVRAIALLIGNQNEVDWNVIQALKYKAQLKIADTLCGRKK